MISFKKIFTTTVLISVSLHGIELKELINSTIQNNKNIQSLKIKNQSLNKTYSSVKNKYNPTVTVGAAYLQLDGDIRSVQIGQTTTGFAKIGIDLYNGGRNDALKKQKQYEYKSSLYNTISTTKETVLQVVTLFFQTKTVLENIKVFQEKGIALKAQYDRIKTKYDLQMATQDEVLKFQSEYESNKYQIAQLSYQKEQLLQNLSLISNKTVQTVDDTVLPDITDLQYQPSEAIKELQYTLKAQQENKNIISSAKKIQVRLEDTYNIYNYDDYNTNLLKDLPDQQNQLMLNVSYNLFDTTSKDKIQAAQLIKQSTQKKLAYIQQQEMMKFDLAKKQLEITRLKISSLKSAVKMANSVYDMIKIKYENGVVDNITYLDALSKKIYNLALYKQALNDYEIAKANYYFSSGVDYQTILDKF